MNSDQKKSGALALDSPENLFHLIPSVEQANAVNNDIMDGFDCLTSSETYPEVPCAQLIWTNKGTLDLLTYELKQLGWISSRREFQNLFAESKNDKPVRWNFSYKSELIVLMCFLYENQYFIVQRTKGYFTLCESRFQGFQREKFRTGEMRRRMYIIRKDQNLVDYYYERIRRIMNDINLSKKDYCRTIDRS
jgi:hypothetical protein